MLSSRILCTNICAFLWQFSALLCAPLQLHLRRYSCLIIENAKNAKKSEIFPLDSPMVKQLQSRAQSRPRTASRCACSWPIFIALVVVVDSCSSSCFDLFVASSFTLCTLQQFNCVFTLSLDSRFFTAHSKKKMYKKFAVYNIFVALFEDTHNTQRERER